MKHQVCKKAICPYYKKEDSQVIYCDGVEGSSSLHVTFASKTDALEYKKTYCRDKYMRCEICKLHESKVR